MSTIIYNLNGNRMYDIPGKFIVVVIQVTRSSRLLLSHGVTLQNGSIVSPSILFQDVLPGGQYSGYAKLLILQMLRNDPTLNSIGSAAAVLQGNQFCAAAVDSDTTIGNIRTLTAAATYTQAFGPFTFAFGSECDLRVLGLHEQSFTNTYLLLGEICMTLYELP